MFGRSSEWTLMIFYLIFSLATIARPSQNKYRSISDFFSLFFQQNNLSVPTLISRVFNPAILYFIFSLTTAVGYLWINIDLSLNSFLSFVRRIICARPLWFPKYWILPFSVQKLHNFLPDVYNKFVESHCFWKSVIILKMHVNFDSSPNSYTTQYKPALIAFLNQ